MKPGRTRYPDGSENFENTGVFLKTLIQSEEEKKDAEVVSERLMLMPTANPSSGVSKRSPQICCAT